MAYDEEYWKENYPSIVEIAGSLKQSLSKVLGQSKMNFTRDYIDFDFASTGKYFFRLKWTKEENIGSLGFRIEKDEKKELKEYLDGLDIRNTLGDEDKLQNTITIDNKRIKQPYYDDVFIKIAKLVKDRLDKKSLSNELDEIDDDEDVEKKFKSWLLDNQYAPDTVRNYINCAELLYKEWSRKQSPTVHDSLWDILDHEVIDSMLKDCEKGSELSKYDRSNGSGSNGLRRYKEFLSDGINNVGRIEKKLIKGGKNIILYGVPGSGKSYTIKKEVGKLSGLSEDDLKDDKKLEEKYDSLWEKGCVARVVFHPDYTYSDFIGQILPEVVNKKIEYRFRAGPFTRILKKANARPKEPFFLIIEEINRGNAAAIFGDIFQLLDRDAKGKSEYNINNKEVYEKVYEIVKNDDVMDNNDNGDDEKNYEICIPPNLWLLATMNTSDQNVFPLDTAFQRRWEMELIRHDDFKKQVFFIGDTGVTWEKFANAVNYILGDPSEMASGDKRLGAWFIKRDPKIDDKKFKVLFANKVLKYLWDDAFKFNREKFFNTEMKTLEKVIYEFVKGGKDFGNILSDSAKSAIIKSAIIGKTEGQNG
ncbi:MAG: AAA family ATPase [Chitinispirillales bacterium]|jgi:hypothetical protein|nr:AAA family ATPase [Chitinispirillales bacterium]